MLNKSFINVAIIVFSALTSFSCGGGGSSNNTTSDTSNNTSNETNTTPVSFQDVLKIMENNCASCHGNPTANGAPMSLTNHNEISFFADSIIDRIQKETTDPLFMPKGADKLSDADIETIKKWKTEGSLNN